MTKKANRRARKCHPRKGQGKMYDVQNRGYVLIHALLNRGLDHSTTGTSHA